MRRLASASAAFTQRTEISFYDRIERPLWTGMRGRAPSPAPPGNVPQRRKEGSVEVERYQPVLGSADLQRAAEIAAVDTDRPATGPDGPRLEHRQELFPESRLVVLHLFPDAPRDADGELDYRRPFIGPSTPFAANDGYLLRSNSRPGIRDRHRSELHTRAQGWVWKLIVITRPSSETPPDCRRDRVAKIAGSVTGGENESFAGEPQRRSCRPPAHLPHLLGQGRSGWPGREPGHDGRYQAYPTILHNQGGSLFNKCVPRVVWALFCRAPLVLFPRLA